MFRFPADVRGRRRTGNGPFVRPTIATVAEFLAFSAIPTLRVVPGVSSSRPQQSIPRRIGQSMARDRGRTETNRRFNRTERPVLTRVMVIYRWSSAGMFINTQTLRCRNESWRPKAPLLRVPSAHHTGTSEHPSRSFLSLFFFHVISRTWRHARPGFDAGWFRRLVDPQGPRRVQIITRKFTVAATGFT